MMLPLLEQKGAVPTAAGRIVLPSSVHRLCGHSCPQTRRAASSSSVGDRDVKGIVRSAAIAAALWATESIALEPEQPPSLPALDFNCYMSGIGCNEAVRTATPPEGQGIPWLGRTKGVSPMRDWAGWRRSTVTFAKRFPARAQTSVSPRGSSRAMVFKAPPMSHQAGR
jgi:hypothetical protein